MQVTRPGSSAMRRRLRRPSEWFISPPAYQKVTVIA